MFLGHFAIALAAKPIAPRVSLGTLFLAAQLADLLWPTLLLLGVEQVRIVPGTTVVTPLSFDHYPVSHSLLALIGWGAVLGLVHYGRRHDARAGAVLALLVVSHWALDALVHRPDLPLLPGNALRIGAGLWNSLPATLLLELGGLAVGAFIYRRATQALDTLGRVLLLGLLALLLAIYAANLLGPAPPGVSAIAYVGHAQWLLVAWGYWIDRHRTARANVA
jgi:hypothetical protein